MRMVAALLMAVIASGAWAADEDKDKQQKPGCPVTRITDNARCMDCHVMIGGKFALKETNPHRQYAYPATEFRWLDPEKRTTAYYLLEDIDALSVERVMEYLHRHPECTKLIIDMHNPGGSMFGMWRIVSLLSSYQATGRVVETRCRGFAASAAFVVFVAGSRGHRFVAPQALLMWHEAMSFSFFNVKTASSTADEAEIMRKFQDTAHEWLASRSKVKKEDLDRLVAKREWWFTGREAVKHGFADGFLEGCGDGPGK